MEVLGILLALTGLGLFGANLRQVGRVRRARALLAPVDGDVEVALGVAAHVARDHASDVLPIHVVYGLVQDATVIEAIGRLGGDAEAIDRALLDHLEATPLARELALDEPTAPLAIATARVYARHHGRDTTLADVWHALAGTRAAALIGVPPARLARALVHGDDEPRAELAHETAVHVVLRNDDYTTFEFVIATLREVFELSEAAALAVAQATHADGRAVVGRFAAPVAKTKILAAWERADRARFPLWVGAEVC